MLICAAGDIHGAMDRLYQDVLAFEASLGLRFDYVGRPTGRDSLEPVLTRMGGWSRGPCTDGRGAVVRSGSTLFGIPLLQRILEHDSSIVSTRSYFAHVIWLFNHSVRAIFLTRYKKVS
jgi:hypothetical protein